MPNVPHVESANRLLNILSQRSRQSFLADCERVPLELAQVLCEANDPIQHVYFPIDSFISLVTTLADDSRLEVGIVGSEGMLGTSLLLGVNVSPQRALVQGAGTTWRMAAATFVTYCEHNPSLREELYRYLYVLTSQLAQSAACTHYHNVEQRLARWLLLTRDRARSNRFHLTHEFLAYMLGVRRVGITEAATALHELKVIEYRRGEIAILDGKGLERAACPCYRAANAMYESILGSHAESKPTL
jgi:CRP-like cAMP-binding protein